MQVNQLISLSRSMEAFPNWERARTEVDATQSDLYPVDDINPQSLETQHAALATQVELAAASQPLKLEVAQHMDIPRPYKIGLLRALDVAIKTPFQYAYVVGNAIEELESKFPKNEPKTVAALLSIDRNGFTGLPITRPTYFEVFVPEDGKICRNPRVWSMANDDRKEVIYSLPTLAVINALFNANTRRIEPQVLKADKLQLPTIELLESADKMRSSQRLLIGNEAVNFARRHYDSGNPKIPRRTRRRNIRLSRELAFVIP